LGVPTQTPSDADLVARYRENYSIPESMPLTVDQVRQHMELERRLTRELQTSAPDDRWDTFERCYIELYESLPWLVETSGALELNAWEPLLGNPGSRVYEVGSGAGRLAAALAERGYIVTATDISRKRGADRAERPNLNWGITDGVHLGRFAEPGAFDVVLSDQLIEHLHPDDLVEHLHSARELLRIGGRYIFQTPHALTGPHDVSRVFGLDAPIGMHLREYTNRELAAAVHAAGYSRAKAVFYSPRIYQRAVASEAYLRALIAIEWLLSRAGVRGAHLLARRLRGPLRLNVFMVAER
jgi:SAM-dependent methyltransferase